MMTILSWARHGRTGALPWPCLAGMFALAASAVATADDPRQCLATTLYFEARAQDEAGMTAVGQVVLNRVASDEFPDRVCAVVREGGETPPCQFAYWCDGRSDRPDADDPDWALARQVADRLLERRPRDRTGKALFFHSADIEPPWVLPRQRTTRVGDNIFYR